MAKYMAAADLVVSRAGASSLAEIQVLGKASYLIPYPYATENHQYHNAMALVKNDAAMVCEQKELTAEKLGECYLEGTRWTIPTFKEVLQQVDGQVPLIIELKSEGNTEALCKAVVKALRGYRGAYCIESFDPRVVFWFRKNRPEITRGQLSKNFIKEPTEHKFPVRFILTSLLCNFLTNPDFIAYNFAHRNDLGNVIATRLWKLQPVSWTINNKRDGVKAKKEGSIIIFENYLP
jgi:glycerophosphoryl diester phosphodiesterase